MAHNNTKISLNPKSWFFFNLKILDFLTFSNFEHSYLDHHHLSSFLGARRHASFRGHDNHHHLHRANYHVPDRDRTF